MKRQRNDRGVKDERFAKVEKDQRFKPVNKKEAKVKLDPRFKPMLQKDDFRLATTRDKYGRKVEKTTGLERFYDAGEGEDEGEKVEDVEAEISSSEEKPPKKKLKVDKKKQKEESEEEDSGNEAPQFDGDSDEEDDEDDQGDMEIDEDDEEEDEDSDDSDDDDSDDDRDPDVISHESDSEEVPQGEPAKRLSVIDIDWDRVRSLDVWMAFQSFLPPGGVIKSVTIYKSDMGKQMMEEEEKHGPPVFNVEPRDANDWDSDPVNETLDERKLRKYMESKRRWFFCIVETDSVNTAKVLYESLDGKALESGREMDLRYVPDEISFKGREIKDQCTKPPGSGYAPSVALLRAAPMETTAKMQNLEWDVTDPARLEVTMRKFSRDEINELDFKAYLASSSDESESDFDEEETKQKYRELISSINGELGLEERSSEEEEMGDMEVTFTPGLTEKALELVKKHQEKKEGKPEKTVFDKYVEKRAAKKKEQKEKRKLIKEGKFKFGEDNEAYEEEGEGNEGSEGNDQGDEMEVDNDEAFADRSFSELEDLAEAADEDEEKKDDGGTKQKKSRAEKKKEKRKKKDLEKKGAKKKDPEADKREKADLDLLVFDPTKGGEDELLSDEEDREQYKGMSKKKAKRQMKAKEEAEDKVVSQKIVKDERFAKLIDDPRFSRDPTSVNYNPTASANLLIHEERHKKLEKNGGEELPVAKKADKVDPSSDGAALKSMVAKIKGRMGQPAPQIAPVKSNIQDARKEGKEKPKGDKKDNKKK